MSGVPFALYSRATGAVNVTAHRSVSLIGMNEALRALNRFGLGARIGERRRVTDPKAWLRAQLDGPPPVIAAPAAGTPAALGEAIRAFRSPARNMPEQRQQLRRRLVDDHAWIEFEGTMTAKSILAGAGNIDENVLHDPGGTYEAVTIRTFDAGSGQWSIFWVDGRRPRPDPPVIGAFRDSEGIFQGGDVLDGRPILVRFLWSIISGDRARWEQSFSDDDCGTWERNWIMDFERQS